MREPKIRRKAALYGEKELRVSLTDNNNDCGYQYILDTMICTKSHALTSNSIIRIMTLYILAINTNNGYALDPIDNHTITWHNTVYIYSYYSIRHAHTMHYCTIIGTVLDSRLVCIYMQSPNVSHRNIKQFKRSKEKKGMRERI